MSGDDFHEGMMRDSRRMRIQRNADRDKHLAVLRKIWEACDKEQQNELQMLLYMLEMVQTRIGRVTKWRLAAPNIATSTFDEDCPPEFWENDAINAELHKTPTIFITPAEYLCAIACWKAGEEYVPDDILVERHPRWPLHSMWDTAKPTPDDPEKKGDVNE